MHPQQHNAVQSGLIDVSTLSLDDLEGVDRSVLGLAVQELLDPNRRDGAPVAGFTSYTEDVD
ncbi:FxSxx-COOH cyclophane-containing RiPP peptide [Actinomadura rubrisoli]|uniref:FXSXX-COOH protein n=1 Tax=Actinomadura rubrisoli TaxID=2530368 RepID=A0A4R5C851_9ACTN|nr:FxSxx-COOH cyclophane-containing RiPP peptide [Actinomadura rubrisoli]TDD95315.1 FXSXX-COOH protein [Actinomadura rubrisoli]